MGKKNMQSIVNALTPIANELPTQNVKRTPAPATPKPVTPSKKPPASADKPVQFGFILRKSLRRELADLADGAEMTMRAFILLALKEKGLSVRDEDLLDQRKER